MPSPSLFRRPGLLGPAILVSIGLVVAFVGNAYGQEALKVNVNAATVEQLAYLPGVGAAIAERIVTARPYQTVGELAEKVKGIGPKKLEAMRPYVLLSGPTTATTKIRVSMKSGDAKTGKGGAS